ncbi:hypothetical protein ACA910_014881 [Epithemia clementina (nom. ined.)]
MASVASIPQTMTGPIPSIHATTAWMPVKATPQQYHQGRQDNQQFHYTTTQRTTSPTIPIPTPSKRRLRQSSDDEQQHQLEYYHRRRRRPTTWELDQVCKQKEEEAMAQYRDQAMFQRIYSHRCQQHLLPSTTNTPAVQEQSEFKSQVQLEQQQKQQPYCFVPIQAGTVAIPLTMWRSPHYNALAPTINHSSQSNCVPNCSAVGSQYLTHHDMMTMTHPLPVWSPTSGLPSPFTMTMMGQQQSSAPYHQRAQQQIPQLPVWITRTGYEITTAPFCLYDHEAEGVFEMDP